MSSQYQGVIKATVLLGGVQIVNILAQIVRSKYIATSIGATGIGFLGIYSNTLLFMSSIFQLGLGYSAIKMISERTDAVDIGKVIYSFRKILLFLGLLGVLFTVIFSPFLSYIFFDNDHYIYTFCVLSVALVFAQIHAGYSAIFQGLRALNQFSMSNILGAILGAILSVIFLYFLGEDGVIYTVLSISFASFISASIFYKNVDVPICKVNRQEFYDISKELICMGGMMVFNGLMFTGVGYFTQLFVSNNGGVHEVGIYTAGWTIMNGYVGIIFTAMSSDYFPRLSAVNNDNDKMSDLLNNQAHFILAIIGPIVISLMIFLPWIVDLLFSKDFNAVIPMLRLALLGVIFKALSWCISFVTLSKSDTKKFLIIESISNSIFLLMNLFFYTVFGLLGLGLSFLLGYVCYLCIVYVFVYRSYGIFCRSHVVGLFVVSILFSILCFCFLFFECHLLYSLSILLFSVCFSVFIVDKNVGFLKLIFK